MTYELGYGKNRYFCRFGSGAKMNRNVDLTSVFNWNVKQLFVFIVAEYSSKANVRGDFSLHYNFL